VSLRIGILGAARITPMALVRPARPVREVSLAAVAARDPARARKFADKYKIPRVHDSYEALLDDPEIDAIYNPLPNGLHCEWTIRALEAGKHVLCEKPIASNAAEGERMADAAARTGRKLVEAFHYRYHPLVERMLEVIASGELGKIHHVETSLCVPIPFPNDIRFRYELGGGATMDTGCYAVHFLRTLAGAEPEVVAARAKLLRPEVDRYMEATVRFADGRTGALSCALLSAVVLRIRARVRGSAGEMTVFNFIMPHAYHRLTVRTAAGTRRERVAGEATYTHQLRAFAAHVLRGEPVPTGPADAIANMRVIDAIYDRAGMRRRGL
jgi:predicted dehydrogenase